MRKICAVLLGTLLLAGCHKPQGKVLGKAPSGEARSVIAVKAGDTPPNVILSGIMVEKCPVAGCWFRLQDSTGMIKIDTRAAGFVVAELPLETKLTVAGKVSSSGDEILVEATGLRY
jgi:uncharacterized protein YdeI (BOF family)